MPSHQRERAHARGDRSTSSRAGANDPQHRHAGRFERFAQTLTHWTGSTPAFLAALAIVVAWAVTGPFFGYGQTWQLVINTGTTIVTFLMVFLIQRAQNKDSLALHLKLNELIASQIGASNRLVNLEDVGEDELHALHRHYAKLAALAARDTTLLESHSVDEAEARHGAKSAKKK